MHGIASHTLSRLKSHRRRADIRRMSPKALRPLRLLALAAPLLLAGCDLLGIESPEKVAAKKEAEGKAIGAGCRHSARSVETCYELNKRADKAAIFAGWKEMNEYMAENKIEAVPPAPPTPPAAEADEGDDGDPVKKSAKGKAADKVAEKPAH
jgi:hypothetical protein